MLKNKIMRHAWALLLVLAVPVVSGCSDETTRPQQVQTCEQADCASKNRECTPAPTGATCDACLDGYVLSGNECVPAQSCAELDCAAENRVCTEASAGTNAACSTCRPGYFQGVGGKCLEDGTAVCKIGDPNSIVDDCHRRENRGCEESETGAACTGGCLPGFKLEDADDVASRCVAILTCLEVEKTCDGVCIPHENKDAECVDNPCGDGKAYVPGAQGANTCVSCNFEGLTGCTTQNLPKASGDDVCVCVTEPGYFWNPNRFPVAGPELCDKDEDGWVDQRAATFFSDPTGDPTLRKAASCNFQVIDRFVLKNDIAGDDDREVMISELTGQTPATVILQESVRNDDPVMLKNAYNAGELMKLNGTQQLPAAALNSLTKICGDLKSDFNDNGISDLSEFQPAGVASDAGEIFKRMSYFMMLADGRFEPSATPGKPGRYVITERSRGRNLALRYESDSGDFWKSCPRFPDAIYADRTVVTKTGTDFARYSTPPPEHRIYDSSDWQGLNHNSQFKCLNVVATEPTDNADKGPHVVLKSKLESDKSYTLNDCAVTGEQAATGGPNPTTLEFSCSPKATPDIGVRWAAVNYIAGPYSDPAHTGNSNYVYQRGCADMCETWRAPACAGATNAATNDAGKCFAEREDFGRRFCGCSLTYGGQKCDTGCTSMDNVMHSPSLAINPTLRAGQYWMCGGVSGTFMDAPFIEDELDPDNGFSVRGEISIGGAHGSSIMENVCDPTNPACKAYTVR